MRTIKGYISSNSPVHIFDFEVEDDASDDEIADACWKAGCNYIDCWWEEGEWYKFRGENIGIL